MTHETTTPGTENAMEDAMTANDTQGACAAEGAKDLRNAPRAGHSLGCAAEPRHRDSERARGAGNSPRTGTPPLRIARLRAAMLRAVAGGRRRAGGRVERFLNLLAVVMFASAASMIGGEAKAQTEFHSTWMTVKTATRSTNIFGYDSLNTRYPGSSMADNTEPVNDFETLAIAIY